MPSAPLVSLLIPTFNSALTVAEAMHSCRQQTFRDIEILIYDEVSKDNTRQIIQAAARQDPRIRFFSSETNSGPVRAWRKLLHEARGQYAGPFVWADDLILPRYVEALTGSLQQNPSQLIAVCNAYSETLPATVQNPAQTFLTGGASRALLHQFPTGRIKGDVHALGILRPSIQSARFVDCGIPRRQRKFLIITSSLKIPTDSTFPVTPTETMFLS